MSGRIVVCALAGALLAAAGMSSTQSYPVRPIRVIVPAAAGGAGDITARAIGHSPSVAAFVTVTSLHLPYED